MNGNVEILPDPFSNPNSPQFIPPIYSQTFSLANYTINFLDGVELRDGEYTLIIEDDAGNRIVGGSEQKYTVETVKPFLGTINFTNNTDTGISFDDRITNKARPEINVTSESGLRIFIQKVENDQSTTLLPKNGVDSNPVYSVIEPSLDAGLSVQYDISFLNDLVDGQYKIFAEDDAGIKMIQSLNIYLLLIEHRQLYLELI